MVGVQPDRVHLPIGISGAARVGEENDLFDAFCVAIRFWTLEQHRCEAWSRRRNQALDDGFSQQNREKTCTNCRGEAVPCGTDRAEAAWFLASNGRKSWRNLWGLVGALGEPGFEAFGMTWSWTTLRRLWGQTEAANFSVNSHRDFLALPITQKRERVWWVVLLVSDLAWSHPSCQRAVHHVTQAIGKTGCFQRFWMAKMSHTYPNPFKSKEQDVWQWVLLPGVKINAFPARSWIINVSA